MQGHICSEAAPYSTKLAAAGLLAALTELVRHALQSAGSASGSSGGGAEEEAGSLARAALLGSIAPLVRHVFMPRDGWWHHQHLCGKAAIGCLLRHLLALCTALPAGDWSAAWAAVGGTYWLSRLAQDEQGPVRQLAFSLMAVLALPPSTHAMLARGWPECGSIACKVAANAAEGAAVRAAALRVVVAAMGHDKAAAGELAVSPGGPPCSLAAPFMLGRRNLWEAVLQSAQVRAVA